MKKCNPLSLTRHGNELFNGKDLTGWQHVGDGFMTVEDGIIQTHGGMGLLYWREARSATAFYMWSGEWRRKTAIPGICKNTCGA